MANNLPNAFEGITPNAPPSRAYYNFFRTLQDAIDSGTISTSTADALVAALAVRVAAVESGGTAAQLLAVMFGTNGVGVFGDIASGVEIRGPGFPAAPPAAGAHMLLDFDPGEPWPTHGQIPVLSTTGEAIAFAVTQAAHGFSVGMPVYKGAIWAQSDRDLNTTTAVAIVSAVANADNFSVVQIGRMTLTTAQWDARTGDAGGLTVGDWYFLHTVAGGLTKTAPTSGLSQCLLKAETSTVAIVQMGEVFDVTAGAATQPSDATLTALAAADWAANALPIGTGVDTLTQTAFAANTFPARASTGNLVAKPITDAALTILDDTTVAAMRTTLVLGNVDNTSDANKPVSTAQAAADALKLNITDHGLKGTSSGSTNTTGKTMVTVAKFATDTTSPTGAIVFIAPTTATNLFFMLNVRAMLYAGAIQSEFTVTGYINGAGAWSTLNKVNKGVADIQTRFARNASGFACLILGDTGTVWSTQFPHITVDADISYVNATDAYMRGWTTALITSLTGYTDISSTIAAVGINGVATAATIPNNSYRVMLNSSASHTAAQGAATYWLGQGYPAVGSSLGSASPANVMYLDPADFPTIGTLTTKCRVRMVLSTNDVAPTGTYIGGLYAISRPAASGGAGLCSYQIDAVVSGSATNTISAPSFDTFSNMFSSDFAIPAAGYYVLAFVQTGTVAASAHMHITAELQMRNT